MPDCVCDVEYRNHHHYVSWVYQYFSDCVYETQDYAAFFIGYVQAPVFLKFRGDLELGGPGCCRCLSTSNQVYIFAACHL